MVWTMDSRQATEHNDRVKPGVATLGFNYGVHASKPRRIEVQHVGLCDRIPCIANSTLEFGKGIKLLGRHALHHDAE